MNPIQDAKGGAELPQIRQLMGH
ncbi:hypothetical protein RSAG8_13719, partial [Rhizoctonia solani AG-8 WAC10335]